ncbi:MAG: PIN domain-containing protein [Proteobacteria bacterium]|nr:PIN domain-containing protein [Pseudomonadota bacterium]
MDVASLPDESAITAITLAELAAGPLATQDEQERARRQDRLQFAAATWDALPFDAESARAYARVFAAARAAGRTHRSRLADLLIASTAASNGLALHTSNPADFKGLKAIVRVIAV